MDIFEKAKALKFPRGKYLVVGGAMEAHGLRPANDIDVVVTADYFEQLLAEGWELCKCEKCEDSSRRVLKNGDVDIYSDYKLGNFQPETDDLIKRSDIIQDTPFVRLQDLAAFKRELGREKDVKDVAIIEEHLSRPSKER